MARRLKVTLRREPDGSKGLDSLMEEYTSRLERRVAYESQFFKQMADALPQIVWTARPNGEVDYFNSRWYEFTGFREGSLEKGRFDIMHPDDIPKSQKAWKHSLKTGKSFEAEYRFFDYRDKEYRWFLGRALAAYDEKGKIIKWFGTSTDIDEHKKAQAYKDEFIAITSHELKTPLTSIKAFSQLLSYQLEEAGQVESIAIVQKINQQIDRLNNLVKDLLEISLLESGQLKLHRTHFSFDKFVKDTVDNLQLINRTHHLKIKGRSGLYVYADRDRLEQALSNLITNGVKYSPNANKVIVSVKQTEGAAEVSVKDFGLGIPKKAQASVFERFFRVSGPNYESFSGFGLGLYIALQVIKREGGKLWLQSQVGKGSTFSFSLPASKRH